MELDVLVIGGGPAGMAAAMAAEAAGAGSVLLVERSDTLGGILSQCTHSGFGLIYFGEELTGPQYAARLVERVKRSGVEVMTGTMALSLCPDGTAVLSGEESGLLRVRAKAVVLATGCRERTIGALMVAGTRPAGVFTAGAVQKMVNIGGYDVGDRFVVLGSGDVGMIVARQLKLLGKEVVAVVEKEGSCGGSERNRVQCLERFGIPLVLKSTVVEIHGVGRVAGVTVRGLEDGNERYIACDTLITSIGLVPERELAEEAAEGGRVPEWLFLCGNACYVHETADEATAEAETAGRLAAAYALTGKAQAIYHAGPEPVKSPGRGEVVCVACPKACPLTPVPGGYVGAACGRKDPVPSHRPGKAER